MIEAVEDTSYLLLLGDLTMMCQLVSFDGQLDDALPIGEHVTEMCNLTYIV